MRILLVIQELGYGGAERVVAALRDGGRDAGHEMDVLASPPLPLVERRAMRLPGAVRCLGQRIRSRRFELIHCHNPTMALVGMFATRRGRRPPALVTMHGVPPADYPGAARVLRVAGLPVVACGPGVARALDEAGLHATRTIVNGVTPAPEPLPPAALREELGIPASLAVAVSVGRLVEQKNHALTVRALAELPNVALIVVGDGPLRDEIVKEAETAGVSTRVFFTGARDDARAIVGAADVFVLSSHWEGLPLAALEALAAGTPVVATSVLGTGDLLTDGEDALLVSAGDAEALGAAVRRVLSDDALRAQLRAGGLRLAAAHTEERMVRSYLDLYAELRR